MSYGLAIVNPTLTENRMAPAVDEGALILRCQAGEKQAYGELVNKYMKRAYYTALGLIGSPEAAMDLSQEAFIRAYRAIKRLDADKKFFTWYYRILKNLCLNYLRDRARHARPFSEVGETTLLRISDQSEDASKQVEQEETKEMVWDAINSLNPQEREIIILKDFQEHSYKEISELLDCPMGTVMSRLYNARQALKVKLEKVLK
ncbi:sigma-70 family RNA polymerase sigma factor [candidate division KSB1 bacterium]|nr:sigma-70 family RNA polymerase sigma factor [candidate division KSB1 bacterium]